MSRSKRRPFVKKGLVFLLPFFILFFAACSDQYDSDTASITLIAEPTELVADGNSATQIRAEILDAAGEPVYEDTRIVFRTNLGTFKNGKQVYSARTPNDEGVKVVSLNTGTTPGTANVSAESKGARQGVNIRFLDPGKVGSIELNADNDTITADGKSSTMIRATVRGPGEDEDDPFDGEPVEGVIVTFTTTLGEFGEGNQEIQAVTDVDGDAAVELISVKTLGTAEVAASAIGMRAAAAVDFVAGKPESMNLRAAPSTIRPGGNTEIIARVIDVNDNPVEGEEVVFEVMKNESTGDLDDLTAITDVNGEARVGYTAGGNAGTDQITRKKQDGCQGSFRFC